MFENVACCKFFIFFILFKYINVKNTNDRIMFLYCDYLIVNISKTRDDDIFNYSLTHIYVCIRACDILLCRCFLFFIFGSSGYLILDLVKLMKSLMQFSFGNHLILKF